MADEPTDEPNDDELLELLADEARLRDGESNPSAADSTDPRWEELAEGTLSDAEREAFVAEQRARATTPEEHARIDAMLVALQPLDPDEEARLVERVSAAIAPELEAPPAAERPANVVPLAPRARRNVWLGGAALAIAAAASLLLVVRAGPALPSYGVEVSGGARVERGAEEATARFGFDDHLVVVLRPRERVEGAVVAHVYRVEGERLVRLDVPLDVSATGAVRLDARVGDLVPTPGPAQIVITIAGAPHAPEDPGVVRSSVRFEVDTR